MLCVRELNCEVLAIPFFFSLSLSIIHIHAVFISSARYNFLFTNRNIANPHTDINQSNSFRQIGILLLSTEFTTVSNIMCLCLHSLHFFRAAPLSEHFSNIVADFMTSIHKCCSSSIIYEKFLVVLLLPILFLFISFSTLRSFQCFNSFYIEYMMHLIMNIPLIITKIYVHCAADWGDFHWR